MEQKKENSVLAKEYIEEGLKAFLENNYNDAMVLYENAAVLYQQLEDWENCVRCHNMLGGIYSLAGNESMAVDNYLAGLECAKAHRVDQVVALFYNNVGYRYQALEKYDKALEFYRKAEGELNKTRVLSEVRYPGWCVITYLNMMASFFAMGEYQEAKEYLEKARTFIHCEASRQYVVSFKILENCLNWELGEKESVREKLPELVESVADFTKIEDYVEDVRTLVQLLKKMKEYKAWEKVLSYFEQYAEKQGTIYFQMVLTEMWMDYYKESGDRESYTVQCVKHAELYQIQKKINEQERADAIDMKISLQQKEAERRKAESELNVDMLTGINNRYCLRKDAKQFLRDAEMQHRNIAVGVVDIDHFKEQNDTMGHLYGDSCLREVAKIVHDCLANDGKVYRFGGDEFVLLLLDGSKKNLERIAQKIREEVRISEASKEKKSEIPVTLSQGYISIVPGETENLTKLMKRADQAMYHVKERGRDGFEILLD